MQPQSTLAYEEEKETKLEETISLGEQPSSPKSPPRWVRSLRKIYERCNFTLLELKNFEEAAKEEVWINAIEEEIKMIEKNKTWELIDRLKDRDVIGVKWIYRTKTNPNGSI